MDDGPLLSCWSCDKRATVVVINTDSDGDQMTCLACCPQHMIRTTRIDVIVGVTTVVQGG